MVSEKFPFVASLYDCGDALAAEVDHLQSGGDCGGLLSDAAAPFYWWVKSEASWAGVVMARGGGAGDQLLDFGYPVIECLIALRFKPAPTRVHFEYCATNAVAELGEAA